jgi:hypothetical protein
LAAIPPFSTSASQGAGVNRQNLAPVGAARAAAQRAFFEAALGRSSTPAPAPATTVQAAMSSSAARPNSAPTPADRLARPGSIVNIVV